MHLWFSLLVCKKHLVFCRTWEGPARVWHKMLLEWITCQVPSVDWCCGGRLTKFLARVPKSLKRVKTWFSPSKQGLFHRVSVKFRRHGKTEHDRTIFLVSIGSLRLELSWVIFFPNRFTVYCEGLLFHKRTTSRMAVPNMLARWFCRSTVH